MSGNAVKTGLEVGTAVADPEISVPLLVVTHPKKTLGAVLVAWAIVLIFVGIVMSIVTVTRRLGSAVVIIGLITGAAGGFLTFRNKHKSAKAQA